MVKVLGFCDLWGDQKLGQRFWVSVICGEIQKLGQRFWVSVICGKPKVRAKVLGFCDLWGNSKVSVSSNEI